MNSERKSIRKRYKLGRLAAVLSSLFLFWWLVLYPTWEWHRELGELRIDILKDQLEIKRGLLEIEMRGDRTIEDRSINGIALLLLNTVFIPSEKRSREEYGSKTLIRHLISHWEASFWSIDWQWTCFSLAFTIAGIYLTTYILLPPIIGTLEGFRKE